MPRGREGALWEPTCRKGYTPLRMSVGDYHLRETDKRFWLRLALVVPNACLNAMAVGYQRLPATRTHDHSTHPTTNPCVINFATRDSLAYIMRSSALAYFRQHSASD